MWEYEVEQWTMARLTLGLNEMAAEDWEPVQFLADWVRQSTRDEEGESVDWYTVVFRREKASGAG